MSLQRLERIIEKAERAARFYEQPLLNSVQAQLREIERRIVQSLTPLYEQELLEGMNRSRAYREGRARTILAQIITYLDGLEQTRLGITPGTLVTVYEDAYDVGLELLSVYENVSPFFTPKVNFEAIAAQLRDGEKRLFRHTKEAIASINSAVTEGLALGKSATKVAREIRKATDYTAFRAQSIALTEMSSSRTTARDEFYAEQGIDATQFFATLDDRTCQYCGAKHLNVYRRGDIRVPQHVRCRCYLAPFRRSYLEAGLIDVDKYKAQQRGIASELKARGLKPNDGKAPFELFVPQPIWTPSEGWVS
jgi:SPP1 gp7 family putative phage head morphogenesis protein